MLGCFFVYFCFQIHLFQLKAHCSGLFHVFSSWASTFSPLETCRFWDLTFAFLCNFFEHSTVWTWGEPAGTATVGITGNYVKGFLPLSDDVLHIIWKWLLWPFRKKCPETRDAPLRILWLIYGHLFFFFFFLKTFDLLISNFSLTTTLKENEQPEFKLWFYIFLL